MSVEGDRDDAKLEQMAGLSEHYRCTQVCVTPVGIPVEWPTIDKKKLDEFLVRESF